MLSSPLIFHFILSHQFSILRYFSLYNLSLFQVLLFLSYYSSLLTLFLLPYFPSLPRPKGETAFFVGVGAAQVGVFVVVNFGKVWFVLWVAALRVG